MHASTEQAAATTNPTEDTLAADDAFHDLLVERCRSERRIRAEEDAAWAEHKARLRGQSAA